MYTQVESGKGMESSDKWEFWKYWNTSKTKAHELMVKKTKQLKQAWIHQEFEEYHVSLADNSGMFV